MRLIKWIDRLQTTTSRENEKAVSANLTLAELKSRSIESAPSIETHHAPASQTRHRERGQKGEPTSRKNRSLESNHGGDELRLTRGAASQKSFTGFSDPHRMKRRRLGAGCRPRGRLVLGAFSPYRSWTRGLTSTPSCRHGARLRSWSTLSRFRRRGPHADAPFPQEADMDVLYPKCAGLDVHKDSVVACARVLIDGRVQQRVRTSCAAAGA
jgi:hypothetical protein